MVFSSALANSARAGLVNVFMRKIVSEHKAVPIDKLHSEHLYVLFLLPVNTENRAINS